MKSRPGYIEWHTAVVGDELRIVAQVRNYLGREFTVGALMTQPTKITCRDLAFTLCVLQEQIMEQYSHERLTRLPENWRQKIL